MLQFTDKIIYFSGVGDQVPKEELETYLIQNGATFTQSLKEANLLIEGNYTTPDISDKLYAAKKSGIEYMNIDTIEKEYSANFKINNTLMAIKLTKNMDRLILLLKNKYFSDDTFVQLLKFYDWKDTILYEDDHSRDICTRITQRFCKLAITNHNIQHSPIGIYYTALETTHAGLLEQIYLMPDYKISDRNAHQNQPLTLKEVVALNPNISVSLQNQIMQNQDPRELIFLASNTHLNESIKEKLIQKNDETITLALIQAGNYILKDFESEKFQKDILIYHPMDMNIFNNIIELLNEELQWIYLSQNLSLNSEMIDIILEKNIDNATINLLKNKNITTKSAQKYIELNDKIFNIALAHNENLSQEQYKILQSRNDIDVDISLASNNNVSSEILSVLYNKNDFMIHECLAANINTPFQILMQLMLDNSHKMIVTENPTYREKIKETIGHMTC